MGQNKQLSVFFAGALLFANYTDPAFLGTHFDVGADVFGVAFRSWRRTTATASRSERRIKQMPESFQINIGHPIGPYFKASVLLSAQYDYYKRDQDTGIEFITPSRRSPTAPG